MRGEAPVTLLLQKSPALCKNPHPPTPTQALYPWLMFGHYNFQAPAKAPPRSKDTVFCAQQTTKQQLHTRAASELLAWNSDLTENVPGKHLSLCEGYSPWGLFWVWEAGAWEAFRSAALVDLFTDSS